MPELTYDAITFQAFYPPGLEQTNTSGIVISISPPRGNVRMMEKPLIGTGTMVHYLGPDSKSRTARVRIESSTFSGLETADNSMMALDGTICTVTVTPRTHATSGRSAISLTNCLITVEDASQPISSGDLYSREYAVEIKQIKPYGV